MKKLLFIIGVLMIGHAFADGSVCQMIPGGTLDNFEADFYNQAQRFSTNILPTVTKIYWLLFGIWVLYEMSFNKILGLSIDNLYVWWIARIFIASLIEHIFLNPNFYVGVIQFGAKLGSQMGGFTVDPSSSSPLGAFTPSAIMGINKCVAYAIKNANVSSLNILGSLELWTIQFGFLVISGVAAFYVMYLSIKIWIALFVGFINAMFAGNAWTVNWWQKYLATVIQYALELLIVSAMLGVIFNQLMVFIDQLTATNANIIENYGTYLITMGEVGFMTFLMFTLPSEISKTMGGSFGGKLSELSNRIIMGIGGWNNSNINNSTTNTQSLNNAPATDNGSAKEVFGNTDFDKSQASPNDWQKADTEAQASTKEQWQGAVDNLKHTE